MRIPPYWARATYADTDRRGRPRTFDCCGWSFSSQAAAQADAQARARRASERLLQGETIEPYGYLDRPLREEQIRSLRLGDETVAVVTRNAYGALILNAASVLFVDVDVARPKPSSIWEAIKSLFFSAQRRELLAEAREQTREKLQHWARSNSGHSLRLYETAGGFRLLFTDRRYDPKESRTQSIFEGLGCDPLYRRLCEQQECFRARLTPKPFRCGCQKPPNRFPWIDSAAEEKFRAWERLYQERAAEFTVCRLLDSIGANSQDDEIGAIVELHDRYACTSGTGRLA